MLMHPRPHFPNGLDATSFTDATPAATFFDTQPYQSVDPAPTDFVQNSFAFDDAFVPAAPHTAMAAGAYRQQRPAMPAQDWSMLRDAAQQPPRKRFRPSQRRFSNDAAHKHHTSSPQQPLQQQPQQSQPPHLPTPSQTPTQAFLDAPSFYNTPRSGPSAMSAALSLGAAFDQPFGTADDMPGYAHSAAHSVSSYGHDSPATPRTVSGEESGLNHTGEAPAEDALGVNLDDYLLFSAQDFSALPKFDRPLSDAAYGEDLFGQSMFGAGAGAAAAAYAGPAHVDASLLSPYRHSMSERLQAANQARSTSPMDPAQRRPSPFRPESPYARPVTDFATASGVRQRQKAEADALAYQQHHNRPRPMEQPTISPQDAMLDYHEDASDPPLFPPASSATTLSSAAPHMPAFSFQPPSLASEGSNDMQQLYLTPSFRSQNSTGHLSEAAPLDFPAHLISMETSVSASDADTDSVRLPSSSQGSTARSMPHAFTCSAPGCTQRFDSPGKLTRHRRESHAQRTSPATHASMAWPQQQQQPQQQHPSEGAAVALHSQRSSQGHGSELSFASGTGSPAEDADVDVDESGLESPVGSGMTSAALMQRNAQAGPHRCERINPSTGKPCNTIFSRPYDLTRHEDTIHNGHKKKVRCHLCTEDKTFSRSDALTRHMRVVHPEVDFPGKHRRRHVS